LYLDKALSFAQSALPYSCWGTWCLLQPTGVVNGQVPNKRRPSHGGPWLLFSEAFSRFFSKKNTPHKSKVSIATDFDGWEQKNILETCIAHSILESTSNIKANLKVLEIKIFNIKKV
jgi:hypothetical protein